ncbi:unnamed protein product [Agarophyton chilense]
MARPLTCFTPASPPSCMYIHLPFCLQRCAYCAFPVIVTPERPAARPPPLHIDYVQLLQREISAFFHLYRRPLPPLNTLYLGGGTPSLLHPQLLHSLLNTLRKHVSFSPQLEFTTEMDPATFSLSQAHQFAEAGVNRASVGAQTFDAQLLKLTRRVHSPADIATAVSVLHRASISNVSLDLIAALPHQTSHTWRSSLEEAIALDPQHISVYDLTLEPGTPFARTYSPGVHPLPKENLSANMLTDAFETLSRAGYHHYEVSNFARRHSERDYRSRHNLSYWNNQSFFAFGLGATSLVDRVRFARPRLFRQYREYVDRLHSYTIRSSDLDEMQLLRHAAFPGARVQTEVECLEDYLINRFRLMSEGVSFEQLRSSFGSEVVNRLRDAVEQCSHFIDEGLLCLDTSGLEGDVLHLTEKGALIENSIVADLLWHAIWKHLERGHTEAHDTERPS